METSILKLIPQSLHEALFAEVIETLENAGELPKGTAYPKSKPVQEVSQGMKQYLESKKASKK